MGVMACYRKNCDNIMCDTYISGIGYICYDCQIEFKHYLEDRNKERLFEGEIKKLLEKFMETEKISYEDEVLISPDQFFNKYTRR